MVSHFLVKKLMKGNHVFVDTNILVYAHDRDGGSKHQSAKELIKELWDRPYPPAISIQVLQEFAANLKKRTVPIEKIRELIDIYLPWEVIDNDQRLLLEGLSIANRWRLSLWDGYIIAAAHRAKASILWSEDLQEGQDFDGVRVVNPLY